MGRAAARTLIFVEAIGVHQRIGIRQLRAAFVVIHDHNIDTGALRCRQRIERLRAAIDRDDQLRAAFRDPDQSLARRAVAFHQPVGDIRLGVESQIAQQPDQQRRRGCAVDVIVTEHRHPFAPLDRVGEARGRLVHVAEDRRVGHEAADGRVAVQVERLARAAAREQQLRDQIVGREPLRRGPAPAPRLAQYRALDAKDVHSAIGT